MYHAVGNVKEKERALLEHCSSVALLEKGKRRRRRRRRRKRKRIETKIEGGRKKERGNYAKRRRSEKSEKKIEDERIYAEGLYL